MYRVSHVLSLTGSSATSNCNHLTWRWWRRGSKYLPRTTKCWWSTKSGSTTKGRGRSKSWSTSVKNWRAPKSTCKGSIHYQSYALLCRRNYVLKTINWLEGPDSFNCKWKSFKETQNQHRPTILKCNQNDQLMWPLAVLINKQGDEGMTYEPYFPTGINR